MSRARAHTYTLPASVSRITDGDTLIARATVFPWPVMTVDVTVRLAGCNAREKDEPGGAEATAALAALIPVGSMVLLTLLRRDEYGRAVCAVTRVTDGVDVGARMLTEGWATAWDGHGPKPVPDWPNPAAPPTPPPVLERLVSPVLGGCPACRASGICGNVLCGPRVVAATSTTPPPDLIAQTSVHGSALTDPAG